MSTQPAAIGRYQVVRRLGEGGMGSVYLARDPELDRPVAIKLVKDDLTDDPELRERFSREARSAARLRHPNIITVFDIGEFQGRPFIAMEYIPGESVADLIRRQPAIELASVLAWMDSLCLGLAHAHKAGIVHRDIKPANMMVDPDGVLKIVDFGIARLGDSQLTGVGMLVGTANYMAPEQLLGTGADHRCDIFAVGAVFYELLTARKAFPGTIADGLFNRICNQPPEPLERLRPDLDAEVVAVVGRALEKDPAQRYQDLLAMARDVGRVRARLFGGTDAVARAGADGADEQATLAPTAAAGPGATPAPGRTPGYGQTPPPASGLRPASTPTPSAGSRSGRTPSPTPGGGVSPYARGQAEPPPPREEESQSQRRHRAEIFVDAADMAFRQRDFAKARALLDDAARFDAGAPGLADLRAQVDQAETDMREAETRRAEADGALNEASGFLSRGDFKAARAHLDRVLSVDPANFRAQSLSSRILQAEAAARERERQAVHADAATPGGLPWLWIAVAIAVALGVAIAVYLATS